MLWQGSQEIFQELPHEYVPPEMLRKVAEHGSEFLLFWFFYNSIYKLRLLLLF